MGFPSVSNMTTSEERVCSEPDPVNEVLWKGLSERLLLYELDAEDFIVGESNLYDLVFIDAYDGDDIFPRKLWDPHSLFLKALDNRIHPEHGTLVVNLHADSITDADVSSPCLPNIQPMGRYVSRICRAYKDVLIGSGHHNGKHPGLAFTVSVPWVCNTSLVVSKCSDKIFGSSKDMILNTLLSKSLEVENVLHLPFSCLQYVKRF